MIYSSFAFSISFFFRQQFPGKHLYWKQQQQQQHQQHKKPQQQQNLCKLNLLKKQDEVGCQIKSWDYILKLIFFSPVNTLMKSQDLQRNYIQLNITFRMEKNVIFNILLKKYVNVSRCFRICKKSFMFKLSHKPVQNDNLRIFITWKQTLMLNPRYTTVQIGTNLRIKFKTTLCTLKNL